MISALAGIGLITSTRYFPITPRSSAQPELLVPSTPTAWGVLIVCAGGGVGMVAAIRRKASTIVSGVAIVTALMSPLGTAGVALAKGRFDYMIWALFHLTMNAAFIALSTLMVVKAHRLPSTERRNLHHGAHQTRGRRRRSGSRTAGRFRSVAAGAPGASASAPDRCRPPTGWRCG